MSVLSWSEEPPRLATARRLDAGARGHSASQSRRVGWHALHAALAGEQADAGGATHLELLGEMVTEVGVGLLSASGILEPIRHLRVAGRLSNASALWSLLARLPHLEALELWSAGPLLTAPPSLGAGVRALRLGGRCEGWLSALGCSGALNAVTHLDVTGLQGVRKADWLDVPVELLVGFAADAAALAGPARVIGRLTSALSCLRLRAVEVGRRLGERLADLDGVTDLRLVNCRLPAAGVSHVSALAGRLNRLDLGGLRGSSEGLRRVIGHPRQLEVLGLDGVSAGEDLLAGVMDANPGLRELSAVGSQLSAEQWAGLASRVRSSALDTVNLSHCALDDRLGEALVGERWRAVTLRRTGVGAKTAEGLLGGRDSNRLEFVDLEGCPVGRLAGQWRVRPALEVLCLSGTGVELADPEQFFAASRLPALLDLDLGHNRLDDSAAHALAQALRHQTVRRLRLTDSPRWSPSRWAEIYRACAPTVVELTVGRDWSTQPEALAGLLESEFPVLTVLDLGEGNVGADIVGALARLDRFPRLSTLHVSGNSEIFSELAASPLIGRLEMLYAHGDAARVRASPLLGELTVVGSAD